MSIGEWKKIIVAAVPMIFLWVLHVVTVIWLWSPLLGVFAWTVNLAQWVLLWKVGTKLMRYHMHYEVTEVVRQR